MSSGVRQKSDTRVAMMPSILLWSRRSFTSARSSWSSSSSSFVSLAVGMAGLGGFGVWVGDEEDDGFAGVCCVFWVDAVVGDDAVVLERVHYLFWVEVFFLDVVLEGVQALRLFLCVF